MATTADVAHGAVAHGREPPRHDAHDHDVPQHDYHLVDPSPWPAVGSAAALLLTLGLALWMHEHAIGPWICLAGLVGVLAVMAGWWRDVLRESRTGHHKAIVNRGLRMGMALFITSEVLFFFAFFWAFFNSALAPPQTVAVSWPPEGIHPVDPWDIPFLNTMILLLSGATVTWAHHGIREGDNGTAFKALLITCGLGMIFTGFQIYEYIHSWHEGLTLQAGTFGSTFYMATGFHGFHVFVGTTFLLVCTIRAWYAAFSPEKHVGFEAATWYWHFVDVVWLFLFVSIYLWGGSLHWSVPGS
jgi:cytochrome c oxidase subunit 3